MIKKRKNNRVCKKKVHRYSDHSYSNHNNSYDDEYYDESDDENDMKLIDIEGNRIYFYCSVNKKSAFDLNKLIRKKNRIFNELYQNNNDIYVPKPKPLYLHINSDGGDLCDAFSIVDTIVNSKIPIHTVIEGAVSSAATVISIAGKKRYITSNSILLIHQLRGGIEGKIDDIEDGYTNYVQSNNMMLNHYLKYTKLTEDQIKESIKTEKEWDAEKSIEYGFADEIYKN